jgi:hypothetical protein
VLSGGVCCVRADPGRYILKAPHKFEKSTAANAQYIELGTYRRITVPAGFVAIAFDQGKQIVIRPEDTKDGPFETNSSTFLFDPRNGFQPIQLQVKELDELKVNTRDGVTITARGLITYQIHDPRAAFMAVQDIHGAVKRGAEAMLTSIFLNASIDEIAPPLPTKNLPVTQAGAVVAAAAAAVDSAAGDDLKAAKGKSKVADARPEVLEGHGQDRADFSRYRLHPFLLSCFRFLFRRIAYHLFHGECVSAADMCATRSCMISAAACTPGALRLPT